MKKLLMFLSICTTLVILALPAAARNSIVQPDNVVQDPCSDEGKEALYQSFLKNRKTEQQKAYEDAKKYLGCPAPAQVTEGQQKIIDYLKMFVSKYDDATRKASYRTLLYNDKKYPEAYAVGKELLAAEPENLKVLVDLGANGYLLAPLNNASLTAEGLDYAKRALQQIESGKTVEDWQPLASKDAAVAYLNYTVGALTLEKDPANAVKNLLKAAQFETPLKKSPYTYAYIAGAYETGPYAKQSEEYKAKYSGKDETPESKLALANINQIVDRMIDGYARAVALAATDQQFAKPKTGWQESLATWYKYRNNNSDAGMNEFVASVLSKPLPPEPTPLTALPNPAPASTPAGASSGTPSNGTTTASAAAPQPTTATGTANKTTTTTTTTGNKPANGAKPKNNYRP
jgi:hypothetical protein